MHRVYRFLVLSLAILGAALTNCPSAFSFGEKISADEYRRIMIDINLLDRNLGYVEFLQNAELLPPYWQNTGLDLISIGRPAVSQLIDVIKTGTNEKSAVNCCHVLGDMDAEAVAPALPELLRAFRDPKRSLDLRSAAIVAWCNLVPDKSKVALTLHKDLVDNPDNDVRCVDLNLLSELGEPARKYAGTIERMVSDKNELVGVSAAYTLSKLTIGNDANIRKCIAWADNSNNEIQMTAITALANMRKPGLSALMDVLKHSSSRYARGKAAIELGRLHAEVQLVVPLLCSALLADSIDKLDVLKALGHYGPLAKSSVSAIVSQAKISTDDFVKQQAVKTLGQIHALPEQVVPFLISEWKGGVGADVAHALSQFGTSVIPDMSQFCANSDTCKDADEALLSIGPASTKLLQDTTRSADANVRYHALKTLCSLHALSSADITRITKTESLTHKLDIFTQVEQPELNADVSRAVISCLDSIDALDIDETEAILKCFRNYQAGTPRPDKEALIKYRDTFDHIAGQDLDSESLKNLTLLRQILETVEYKSKYGNTSPDQIVHPVKNKWALVIGLSDFKYPPWCSTGLPCAGNDVDNIMKFLTEYAFVPENKGFIKKLTDAGATRTAIWNSVYDWLAKQPIASDDLLIVYVSSHGQNIGERGYVIAYDTKESDPGIAGSAIDADDFIREIGQRVHCNQILFVFDACHSGSFKIGTKGASQAGFGPVHVEEGRRIQVFSSCAPNQESYPDNDSEIDNSVFTTCLVDALEKGLNLKTTFWITTTQVSNEVKQQRPGHEQTPMLNAPNWIGNEIILTAPPDIRTDKSSPH
jgi:HEAT repeat protein